MTKRLLLAVFCFGSTALSAQVEVLVQDSLGGAVVGAQVQLWSSDALLRARETDWRGVVSFNAEELARAEWLRVRRIGFGPRQVMLRRDVKTQVVRLDPLVPSMTELTVVATVDRCPQQDEPNARQLWASVAEAYLVPSLEGRVARFEQYQSLGSDAMINEIVLVDGQMGTRAHTPQGVADVPCSQLRHLAKMRATVVLPTPRVPVNRNA